MAVNARAISWVLGACCTALLACGGESAPPPPAATAPPAPKVLTSAERADWYRACWDKFNTKAWDDFKKCYSESAEADTRDGRPVTRGADAIIAESKKGTEPFPDMHGDLRLILVNGSNVAGIAIITATNSLPLPGPDGKPMPATQKKIGQLFGHSIQVDNTGAKVVKEFEYFDSGTISAQLGLSKTPARPAMAAESAAPTVVIATNSATETANVAAERKSVEDWNAHAAAAIEGSLADDIVWHEAALPADLDKKGLMASLKEFWKGLSNVKMTADAVWAAGDYAVIEGSVAGVNDGNIPSMGLKKTGKSVTLPFLEIDRLADGKVKEAWLFYDGALMVRQLTARATP